MGISVDYIASEFEIKKIPFIKLIEVDSLDIMSLDSEKVWNEYRYYDSLIFNKYNLYFEEEEKVRKSSEFRYNYYKEKSNELINDIKINGKEGLIRDWFLKQEGRYIYESLGQLKSYSHYEIIEKELWIPKKFVNCNEDGKLIMMALDNLKYLYGYEGLKDICIYVESLDMYAVGENEQLDRTVNLNTIALVEDFQKFLNTVEKKEDDEFFEGRYERWKLILECLKENGKFVYSV